MVTLLDGKTTSQILKNELKKRINRLPRSPTLSIVYVGENQASKVYISNKLKSCEEIGVKGTVHHFDSMSTEQLKIFIQKDLANEDALLVQMPLPENINAENVLETVRPDQDVDGLHYINVGKRLMKDKKAFWPCTPLGVMDLLKQYKINVEGLHAVVIGRSNLVGRPLAALLEINNDTVSQCHSRSIPLSRYTKDADLLVSAIGKTKFIKANMVKEGAIVIDVGMNRDEQGKLCGDVDFDDVKDKCTYITPVPGGIGPMTVVELMQNTVLASENKQSKN